MDTTAIELVLTAGGTALGSILTYRLTSKRDLTRQTLERLQQLDDRIDKCEERHRQCLLEQADLKLQLGRLETQVALLEKKP